MSWLSRLGLLFLGTFIACQTAAAAPLGPGALLYPVPAETTPTSPGVATLAVQETPFVTSTYSGTLLSRVIQGDTRNPFAGGLTFIYQLRNNQGTHSINRLSINGFQGFMLDVTHESLSPLIGIPPVYADREVNGTSIGFSFADIALGEGPLDPGERSRPLIVHSNASTFTESSAFVLNGFATGVATYAPVPEPGTIILGVTGLGMVLLWRRMKRRG
jgi:hypothetical protein